MIIPRHYRHIKQVLDEHDYHNLRKRDKSSVRRQIAKQTGLSRATITRLIRQHRENGTIVDRRTWKE